MRRSPQCFVVTVLATGWCCTAPALAQITLDGGEVQVTMTTSATAFQGAPAVAWEPDGSYVLAWQQQSATTGGWGVLAQQFRTNGGAPPTALGSAFQVSGTSSAFCRQSPAVASDVAGDFVIVWTSDEVGGGLHGIFGQLYNSAAGGSIALTRRFNAAGTALSGQLMVDPSPTGPEHDPVVAANAVGDFVVVFDTVGQDGSGAAVLAQLFDNRNQPQGGKLQLNTTTAGDQAFAGAGLSAGGSLLIAWQSQTAAADAMVITARAAALPLEFYTVPPCRMVDTRNAAGPLGGPILTSGQARNFPLLSAPCGVPATAKALSINATAVTPSAGGSLVIYPGDAATPLASNLNFNAGAVRANNAIALLARDGDGSVTVPPSLGAPGGQVHFLIDVNGYFQ